MRSVENLRHALARVYGRGYKAYKEIQASYQLPTLALHIDHVQGDPFAFPSEVRVRVPQTPAGFPGELVDTESRRMALADILARAMGSAIRGNALGQTGMGKSGLITIDAGGQAIQIVPFDEDSRAA